MPSDTYTLTISDLGVAAVADNAVTTAKIADYNAGIAGTGITTAKIVDLNVTTAKIANSAITTAKLVDSSSTTTGVTTDKIADGAVTRAKLVDFTVSGTGISAAKIADGTITSAKIAALTITDGNIALGAITGAKILNGTITDAKLATISTAFKVSNEATTAASVNTASAIVARNGSGNFSAGTITAALMGNATTATSLAGGTAGAIPYQIGAGTTQFIAAATSAGQLLVSGANGTAAPTWGSGIGGVSSGGTGIYSYAGGDIIYANGANSLTKLAIGPAGSVLTSSGTIPVYLTTLPVASGGTGAATLTGYVKGTGTTAMTASATVPVADIFGTLPVASGGTNQISTARGQISKMTTFTAITVASTGTYYPATNDGTLDTTTSSNMTLGATSTFSIRNTSGVTRVFRVYASADATATANDTLGIKLYAGTAGSLAAIDATECRAFTNSATEAAKLVTSWMISLSNNQEVALYVANHTDAANITIQRARLIAEAII